MHPDEAVDKVIDMFCEDRKCNKEFVADDPENKILLKMLLAFRK